MKFFFANKIQPKKITITAFIVKEAKISIFTKKLSICLLQASSFEQSYLGWRQDIVVGRRFCVIFR
jgi:hypothetical protein